METYEKIAPKLVDYNIKVKLHDSLKKSYDFKVNFYNNIFNIALCVGFFVSLVILLYYRYKGKLSDEEMIAKENEKRIYVLNKLQQLNNIQTTKNNKLITNLPEFVY